MNNEKKYAVILLEENGSASILELEEPTLSLDFMYEKIKCNMIEIVSCNAHGFRDYHIILDEEGKLKGRVVNILATMIYSPSYDFIVGDALIGKQIYTEDGPDIGAFPIDEANKLVDKLVRRL